MNIVIEIKYLPTQPVVGFFHLDYSTRAPLHPPPHPQSPPAITQPPTTLPPVVVGRPPHPTKQTRKQAGGLGWDWREDEQQNKLNKARQAGTAQAHRQKEGGRRPGMKQLAQGIF